MNRYFEMTQTAVQSTWSKLSNDANHIPTTWLVEGDKTEGYTISAVDDNLCGFDLLKLRTLYAAKRFIDQINETGSSDMDRHCKVGSFAWRNHPLPLKLSTEMKVIDVDRKNILAAPF